MHIIDEILGFSPKENEQLSQYSLQAIFFLHFDRIELIGDPDDSLAGALDLTLEQICFDRIRDHRRSLPNHKLATGKHGYKSLCELLFTANSLEFSKSALAISRLRFYLLRKAIEGRRNGCVIDANVECLSEFVLTAFRPNATKSRAVLKAFVDIGTTLQPEICLNIWKSRVSLMAAVKSEAKWSKSDRIQLAVTQLIRSEFKESVTRDVAISHAKVARTYLAPRLGTLEETLPPEYEAPGSDSEPNFRINARKLRASLANGFRVSQHALNVNEHHLHFWPYQAKERYLAWLQKLKQSDQFHNQFKSLLVEVTQLTGLPISNVMGLPVTQFGNKLSYNDWQICVSGEQILLVRHRPTRVFSVRLPSSLADFCYPLADNFQIALENFQQTFITALTPDSADEVLTLKAIAEDRGLGENSVYAADGDLPKTTEWLLRSANLDEFFSLQSIRFQAFGLLKEKLRCPATAELALSRPNQSTSAITGYLAYLNHEENAAGSEIAFSKDGVSRFTKIISDRFIKSLPEGESNSKTWADLLNLASKRLWLIETITLGRRPVATGIECQSELSDNLEYGFLLDKFVRGREEGRIVYIPELLRQELTQFFSLLSLLRAHFSGCAPETEAVFSCARRPLFSILRLIQDEPYHQTFKVEELSPSEVFAEFAHEASEVRNCFRHYWLQQISLHSQCIELTKAFAGHSDDLQMIYGISSNRCRKSDLEIIRKIAEKVIKAFELDSEQFWARLNQKLEQCLSTSTEIHPIRILVPDKAGRALREEQRLRAYRTTYRSIDGKVRHFEAELKKLEGLSAELLRSKREHFLNSMSQKEKGIGNEALNSIFKKLDWPVQFSELQQTQFFPNPNIFEYLKRRDDYLHWIKTSRRDMEFVATSSEVTKQFCMALELIYQFNLLCKTDLLRVFQKGWTRLVCLGTDELYLEIARRYQFHDERPKQCYRIRLPHYMSTLDVQILAKKSAVIELDENLKRNLDIKAEDTIESVLVRIQAEALSIASFEQPAFVANLFQNPNTVSTSTSWNSIVPLVTNVQSKTKDVSEIVASQTDVDLIQKTQPDQNSTLKTKLYHALRKVDWKVVKAEIEKIRDCGYYRQASRARRAILDWASKIIDRSKDKKVSPATVTRYLKFVFDFTEWLDSDRIHEYDDYEVGVLVQAYEKEVSGRDDYKVCASAVNSFLSYLSEDINEAFSAERLAGDRLDKSVRAEWIDEKHYLRLLSKVLETNSPLENEKIAMLSLMYRFGCRLNEAKYMLVEDLYTVDHFIIGIVIRGNKHRRIKGGKPARRIFVSARDPLCSVELNAWSNLIAHRKIHIASNARHLMLFSKELVATNTLEELLVSLREVSNNPNLTFHSLRHSFGNRRASTAIDTPKEILKSNHIERSQLIKSCNALEFVKNGLRHSRIETSFTSYIHILDRFTEYKTRGIRRGSSRKDQPMRLDTVRLKPLEISNKQGRPRVRKLSDTNSVTIYQDYFFVKELSEQQKISLSPEEFSILKALVGKQASFHPSFSGFSINEIERTLSISTPYIRRKFSVGSNLYEKILSDLRTLQQCTDTAQYRKISPLPYLFSGRNEVLIDSAIDFNWLRVLGLGPNLVKLHSAPISGHRVSHKKVNYHELFETAESIILNYNIQHSGVPISREVTDQKHRKSDQRLIVKYRGESDNGITLLFFLLALVLAIKKQVVDNRPSDL